VRRILPLAAFAVLPFLAAAGRAGAEEAPFQFPSMDQAERVQQRHLKVELMGQTAGGVSGRIGHLPDGRMLLEIRFQMQVQRANEGQADVFKVASHETELLAADGRLIAKRSLESEAGVEESSEAVYRENHVDLTFKGPGGTYRKRLEIPADHDSAYRVGKALIAAWKPGTEPTRTYQSLSPKNQRFDPHTSTLLGKTTYTHDGTAHPAWKFRDVDEEGTVAEVLMGEDLLPFSMSVMNGALKATWVNEPTLDVEGGGWSMSSFVTVDHAVPRMLKLESLEVRLRMDPPQAASDPTLFADGPYQKVVREPSGYRFTLTSQRVPAEAAALTLPLKVEDPAVARYLGPTPTAQSDHAEIAAKAKAIVGETKDAKSAVQKIVGWVWAHVEKKSGARGSATAVEVLRSCVGDCSEHAVLVVALCRAAGIPAREISGLEYLSVEGRPLAGFHAWSEVWLGRWVPVDATIPEVGTSARYLFSRIEEPGEPPTKGSVAELITRKVSLEILAWKHEGGLRVEAPKEPAKEPAPVDGK